MNHPEETEVRVFARPPTVIRQLVEGHPTALYRSRSEVMLYLPPFDYVVNRIRRALDVEMLENRRPCMVLVGIRWGLALNIRRETRLFDVPLVLDGSMERGCRVICTENNELDRYFK